MDAVYSEDGEGEEAKGRKGGWRGDQEREGAGRRKGGREGGIEKRRDLPREEHINS